MTKTEIREFIETQFYEFLDNSNPASEYKAKYYSDDAIYEPEGAISQGYDEFIDYHVRETKKLIMDDDTDEITNLDIITIQDLKEFDFDASFQD